MKTGVDLLPEMRKNSLDKELSPTNLYYLPVIIHQVMYPSNSFASFLKLLCTVARSILGASPFKGYIQGYLFNYLVLHSLKISGPLQFY